MGNISAKALYDVWNEKVGKVEGSHVAEVVTQSFIEKSFVIWEKALHKPAIQEVVLDEENMRQRSLFNSVIGMYTLVTKAKTEESIDWVFASIYDGRRIGVLTAESMATRALQGSGTGNNGKGLVDLLIFRKSMLTHLVNTYVPSKARRAKPVHS